MAGRRRRRRRGGALHDDTDPLGAIANLFDVAMVFAVALMVAMVSRWQLTEFLTQEDFTMVKNPGTAEMEIITQEAGRDHPLSSRGGERRRRPPRPAGRHRLPTRQRRDHLRAGRALTVGVPHRPRTRPTYTS